MSMLEFRLDMMIEIEDRLDALEDELDEEKVAVLRRAYIEQAQKDEAELLELEMGL